MGSTGRQKGGVRAQQGAWTKAWRWEDLETFRSRRVCRGAGPPARNGEEAGDPASASLYGNPSYDTDEPICETEPESRASRTAVGCQGGGGVGGAAWRGG